MDLKDPNDKYDIIKQLKEDYGITLVNQNSLAELKTKLEEAYKNDPDFREKLKKKYGFDIIDEDGNVIESNLTMAMIMDDADKKDDYDINKLLSGDETEEPTEIEVPTSTPTESPTEEPTEIEVPTPSTTETPTTTVTEVPTEVEIPTSTPTDEPQEIIVTPRDDRAEVPVEVVVAPQVGPAVSAYDPGGDSSYTEVEVPTQPEEVPEEVPVEAPTEEETELDPAEDEISRLTSIKPQVATAKNDFPVQKKQRDNSGLAALAGIGATVGSAAAGAWLINRKRDDNDEDEDEDDEVEYLSEDEKPMDINPYESEDNVEEIGLDGANLVAAEEESYVARGANNEEKLPESKEFLNELEVKDEDPDPAEAEFDYYTSHRDDSVASNIIEEF